MILFYMPHKMGMFRFLCMKMTAFVWSRVKPAIRCISNMCIMVDVYRTEWKWLSFYRNWGPTEYSFFIFVVCMHACIQNAIRIHAKWPVWMWRCGFYHTYMCAFYVSFILSWLLFLLILFIWLLGNINCRLYRVYIREHIVPAANDHNLCTAFRIRLSIICAFVHCAYCHQIICSFHTRILLITPIRCECSTWTPYQ